MKNKYMPILLFVTVTTIVHQAKLATAETPQANANPSGNSAPARKFRDMPVLECNAILEEIRKQDFDFIMRAWLDAGRVEKDATKQGSIVTLWGYTISQRAPSPEFYKKMKAIMADASYSIQERGQLIGVLSIAATKETADILIYEATHQTDKDLKAMATFAIRSLGENSYNEAISIALEPLWKESNDPQMLASVARSMGRIGAPSSVQLLLSAAMVPDGSDDVRRDKAWSGLREVFTGNAVPPLATMLSANPVGSRANTLAFDTLSQIGDKEGPQAVMKWLQTADKSAAPLAKAWAIHARHTSQVEVAQAALDPAVPFRSEENRKALREGLDSYRAARQRATSPQ